jgi:hypothetical protein
VSNFQNVLPNPLYDITNAGISHSGGTLGPGYLTIDMSEIKETMSSLSISGKLLSRSNNYPKWMVNLRYNPLTKEQFDIVYNFLMQRRGSRTPFYVQLPQYVKSRNSAFVDEILADGNPSVQGAYAAGAHSILIDGVSNWSSTWVGTPWFGDLFTINSVDSLHTKAYQVSFVETPETYKTSVPSGAVRVHFSPGLQRSVEDNAEVIFTQPLIRVVQTSDNTQFKLDSEGLYNLSVSLREAFY